MDSGDDDDMSLENKDFSRMRNSLWKSGYREGLIKGKADGMQEGFNYSYELGLKYGMMLGALRGSIKAKIVQLPEDKVKKLNGIITEIENTCSVLKESSSSLKQEDLIESLETKLAEYKSKIESVLVKGGV